MTLQSILVYGYGTMAGAMVEGWLTAGMSGSAITAYNPRPKPVLEGVALVTQIPTGRFDAVLLGVKPQKLAEVAGDIEPLIGPDTVLLSILAGVDLDSLARHFPRAGGLVRFMPNLAVALGKSPNALAACGVDEKQREEVTRLAEMLGGAEWLADEVQFDLVAALVASGPGFVYRFIDALAEGAAALGLEAEQAKRLAVRMVEGAAALAAASPHTPAELASRVASPGGMTQKGLDVLDADRALARLVEDCLRAARDRAGEMGREAHESR